MANPKFSSYSIGCSLCGKDHALPSAEYEAEGLMAQLESHGRLDFSVPQSGADERLSLETLRHEGQMFGVLKAQKSDGSVSILKAFSGQFNGVWLIDGWAPPLLDVERFEHRVAEVDPEIKKIGRQIDELQSANLSETESNIKSQLIERRRDLSRSFMEEIHSFYRIRNFLGGQTRLSALFGEKGIPSGTGDCCAPKLLNQAILLGLKPLALSEFFWGGTNRSKTKFHRQTYHPCEPKCSPLMAYMLCGADEP